MGQNRGLSITQASPGSKVQTKTYIVVVTTAPEELLQIGGQVIPAVILLDLGRPVVLAGTNENMLGIAGNEAVQGRLVINLEALGELGCGRAGAGRRRACRCRGKRGRSWCLGP